MEKPEIIEAKIRELQSQLQRSQEYYRYESIYIDDEIDLNNNDMIGFFDLGKAKKILTLLNDGKQLKLSHGVYGSVLVKMNPQRNRILVTENSDINEDNIMSFIVWNAGDWYIDKDYENNNLG